MQPRLTNPKMISDLVDSAIAKRWLPPSTDGLIVAPTLGFPLSGLFADPVIVADLIGVLQQRFANARILVIGYGQNPVSGPDLWRRSGLADVLTARSVERIDLTHVPAVQIEKPKLSYSVCIPALAFSAFPLVLVGSLAAHSRHGLIGMSIQQLGLFQGTIHGDLWSLPASHVALVRRLWKPDLCILDARRIIAHADEGSARHVMAQAVGGIVAGPEGHSVDRAVANNTGLAFQDSGLSSGTRSQIDGTSARVIWVGKGSPIECAVTPTPFDYQQRLIESADRTVMQQTMIIDKAITMFDIPRIVSFVRRARGGAS